MDVVVVGGLTSNPVIVYRWRRGCCGKRLSVMQTVGCTGAQW